MSLRDPRGMAIHWLCWLMRRHAWVEEWSPVGHIEGAVWRFCRRGCGFAEMRYV